MVLAVLVINQRPERLHNLLLLCVEFTSQALFMLHLPPSLPATLAWYNAVCCHSAHILAFAASICTTPEHIHEGLEGKRKRVGPRRKAGSRQTNGSA